MQLAPIKIGSRGSPLAVAMAAEVKESLKTAHNLSDPAIKLESITTTGDRIQNRSLAESGGKGLFTVEIEMALLAGVIDIAVHSTKDMPTLLPEGLKISGYLKREDPRDAFVGAKVQSFHDLPTGATVGTAALRRRALVKKLRPDLTTILMRGNIDTRLKKVQTGAVDATFLAMAGVNRLGLQRYIHEIMDHKIFPPAPGQGAICLETRVNDDRIDQLIAPIQDQETQVALCCERQFLASLDGSCRTPIAGYAHIKGDTLFFHGMILTPDGQTFHEITLQGEKAEAEVIGRNAAQKLRRDAGEAFFLSWH